MRGRFIAWAGATRLHCGECNADYSDHARSVSISAAAIRAEIRHIGAGSSV